MKIATLIPAFKLKFLLSAVNSVLTQSVRPDLIIVSDDTTNEEILNKFLSLNLIERFKSEGVTLEIIKGPMKHSTLLNIIKLCKVWNRRTEYLHFLFDDDYIFPAFYENHIRLLKDQNIKVSVSRRWQSDANGKIIGFTKVPDFIENTQAKMMKINRSSLFQSVLPQCTNWLGEFSNAILHESLIKNWSPPDELGSLSYLGLLDIGLFLKIGETENLGFINEHLGFFRRHDTQTTNNFASPDFLAAHLAWIPLAISAENLDLISEVDKKIVIKNILNLVSSKYRGLTFYSDVKKLFGQSLTNIDSNSDHSESVFLAEWELFLKDYKKGLIPRFN